MKMQRARDRFHISHIIVSGIAGGIYPGLHIGDVAVASSWAQYLASVMARKTASGKYQPPPWMTDVIRPNFGMMFPRPIKVRSPDHPKIHQMFWFRADPHMLAAAQNLESVHLSACHASRKRLPHEPRLAVGANGRSEEHPSALQSLLRL